MPLISTVGRRSLSVRVLFFCMYIVLTLGTITMVYPFLLMLAMGTTGRADYQEFRVIPRYLFSDAALFKKYLIDLTPIDREAWNRNEAPYTRRVSHWFGKDNWFSPLDMKEEDLKEVMGIPEYQRNAMAEDVREFIAKVCPDEFKLPAFLFDKDSALALQAEYFSWLRETYGNLEKVNKEYPDNASTWEELGVMMEQINRRPGDSPRERDWRSFIQSRPPERTGLFEADPHVQNFIETIEIPKDYKGEKTASGKVVRSRITFDDLIEGKLGGELMNQFMRFYAPARFVRIDVLSAADAWNEFLKKKGMDPGIALQERIPTDERIAGVWGQFVQSDCPLQALTLLRPEDYWRAFLRKHYGNIDAFNHTYGTHYTDFREAHIPYAIFHYDNFIRQKNELRIKYLTHNFRTVLSFVTVHGSALNVTLIYIILTIVGTLTVNPLAAYALSRFRMKETYHVLIFLLVTMAFPGEVLMIPGFLLIKEFPLLQFGVTVLFLLFFIMISIWLSRRIRFMLSATVSIIITVFVAGWLMPRMADFFHFRTSVSLMNTFWALVLPSLANGYGIFLLKGFFDSLPAELYEAGLIDGASEMRMLWQITIPLCKPILAVMALGAFNAAYGAFMHAFLICQDPKMWTFMVFLYEFQQTHTVPMVMASLVVAAIPTLIVFMFCQKIILRGIVIPSFK